MNEIERRELKGLGGWLVLFQIQVWFTLAGAVQMAIMLLVTVFIDETAIAYSPGLLELLTSPYILVFAAWFVLLLMCVIYFYKKRMVFRTIYIVFAVISIVGLALYYFFYMPKMMQMSSFMLIYTIAIVLVPAVGLMTALIIALYKSHRVKNTFS